MSTVLGVYGSEIPGDKEFRTQREKDRKALAQDETLRAEARRLQVSAEGYGYTYHFEWLGVPIIRLPEDIVLFQEMIYATRASFVVETGVARGGGLVLSASLMDVCGLVPNVLGIDVQILPHAWAAVSQSRYSKEIQLLESDSVGQQAIDAVRSCVARAGGTAGVLVLDSDHSHQHVLAELRILGAILPRESLILVADTLIEEVPANLYSDRPWGRGNSPASAIDEFLTLNREYVRCDQWAHRGLITENRLGVLRKIS